MLTDIVIPVFRPDEKLEECVKRLTRQTVSVRKIYLVFTVEKPSDLQEEEKYWKYEQVETSVIPKREFDHGAVRDAWMRKLDADIVIFMVQDAVPENGRMVEELLRPFDDEETMIVYGRHTVDRHCGEIEKFTRYFNYPPVSMVKTKDDERRLGIKTYFNSDVCAAYRREGYLQTSGFGQHEIASEDAVAAWKVLQKGGKLVYAADAKVIHYHSYGFWEQFRRNFDVGVAHAAHPEIFLKLNPSGEGVRLVKETAKYLIKKKKVWLLIPLGVISISKYAGHYMGLHYKKLSRKVILLCTRNTGYWKEES